MTSNQITALTIYKEPKQKKQLLSKFANKTSSLAVCFFNPRKKYILLFSLLFVVSFLFFGSYLSIYPNLSSFAINISELFFAKKIFCIFLFATLIFGYTLFSKIVTLISAICTALCLGMFSSLFLNDDIYIVFFLSICALTFIVFFSDVLFFSKMAVENRKKIKFSDGLYFILRFVFAISLIDFLIYKISNYYMLG